MAAAQNTLQSAIRSPFPRLRALLGDRPPGDTVIDLTIGEPKHAPPDFYLDVMVKAAGDFGRYPPIAGTPALRQSIVDWHSRRYDLAGALDAERHVLALNGSREGLFSALFVALDRRPKLDRPAVLMPNPFYQAYLAATLAAGAEPVLVPSPPASDWLPDLDFLAKNPELLDRTVAFYLGSPANPQGAVAGADYLSRAIALARQYDFILFADECYSEIYTQSPPPGALAVAWQTSQSLANIVSLNSLSKRSSLPGLRSGFCAGDPDFIARFQQFRNVAAPQVPMPIQAASAALWADDGHVEASRALYQAKFAVARQILGDRFGNPMPPGGFFLWLNMHHIGGGEAAAVTFWQRCGVKVLPGAYLSSQDDDGRNPGQDFIRIALVADLKTTTEALERIGSVIAD